MPPLLFPAEGNPDKTAVKKEARNQIPQPPDKCSFKTKHGPVGPHDLEAAYPFPDSLAGNRVTVGKIKYLNYRAYNKIRGYEQFEQGDGISLCQILR